MRWTRPLRDVTLDDVATVGGKNASLGELLRELVPLGVRVPDGFAVTADAFRALMRESRADAFVKDELAGLRPDDVDDLTRRSDRIRAAITHAPMPPAVEAEIVEAYAALSRRYGEEATDVAVRSSATAEDLPNASFAGQQESFLNVRGAPFVVRRRPRRPSPASSRRARSATASTWASTTTPSRSRSACRRWCARTARAPASSSRSIRRPGTAASSS